MGGRMTDEKYRARKLESMKALTLVDANGCWIWQGNLNHKGYGCSSYRSVTRGAHRIMYELTHNVRLPYEMQVCHHCDNPPCINPAHLWAGTMSQNGMDSANKGRHQLGRNTHCKRGHPFSGDNVRQGTQGPAKKWRARTCKTCERERQQSPRYKAKNSEAQKARKARLKAARVAA